MDRDLVLSGRFRRGRGGDRASQFERMVRSLNCLEVGEWLKEKLRSHSGRLSLSSKGWWPLS